MREQLIRYVDLLFAGAPEANEIKQEILQNTLDRYDDLTAQGKAPQAAYSLAISGIGDITEILGEEPRGGAAPALQPVPTQQADKPLWKKVLRAVGICLYIMCPIPLFVLAELGMEIVGLCGTLTFVAVATALMIVTGSKAEDKNAPDQQKAAVYSPREELRKSIRSIIWAVGLCAYFVLSFTSGAWHITWVIFPIAAAVQGLVMACVDLKEAGKHEN